MQKALGRGRETGPSHLRRKRKEKSHIAETSDSAYWRTLSGEGLWLDKSMNTKAEERWEQLWLPLWPLASDDFRKGVYRMARKDARLKRYIEANPKALSNLLVVDIDHDDAALRAIWNSHGAMPNAVVENPKNGHAHAVWALAEPVTRTEYARRKPLAFAAAVTEGLRRKVDGDKGYSGLMTKNPEHHSWTAEWWTDELYSLRQLAEALGDHMPTKNWRRTRRKNPVGLGRNCAIFETARHWAYREIRHHWGDPEGLGDAIQTEVHLLNAGYQEPLPHSEASAIANSITRWITTKSRMWRDGPVTYEANFIAIQSARGRKGAKASAKVRTARKEQRQETLKELFKCPPPATP